MLQKERYEWSPCHTAVRTNSPQAQGNREKGYKYSKHVKHQKMTSVQVKISKIFKM